MAASAVILKASCYYFEYYWVDVNKDAILNY